MQPGVKKLTWLAWQILRLEEQVIVVVWQRLVLLKLRPVLKCLRLVWGLLSVGFEKTANGLGRKAEINALFWLAAMHIPPRILSLNVGHNGPIQSFPIGGARPLFMLRDFSQKLLKCACCLLFHKSLLFPEARIFRFTLYILNGSMRLCWVNWKG
jgi:hypothetical protein